MWRFVRQAVPENKNNPSAFILTIKGKALGPANVWESLPKETTSQHKKKIINLREFQKYSTVINNLNDFRDKGCSGRYRHFANSFSPLTLSDLTLDLVRKYDFSVLLRCRKPSETVYVAFVRPLSKPVRRFSSCSTDFSQQIAQVVLFLYLHDFLF
jgi:hypothetical protein